MPRFPSAGVRDGDWVGDIGAVDFEVEVAALTVGGDAEVERIDARRCNVDRVFDPFAELGPADVVTVFSAGVEIDVSLVRKLTMPPLPEERSR